MRRRRDQSTSHSSRERWLVSYADFITLLFAFFVVLFTSSQMDHEKTTVLASAIQSAFKGHSAAPSGKGAASIPWSVEAAGKDVPDNRAQAGMAGELRSALAAEFNQNVVSLEAGAGTLTLSLKEVGFFDSGSARLRTTSSASIQRIAAVLAAYANPVRIEGHTDNVPISTQLYASNWELSTARAIEITRLLTTQFGISPARLSVAGFAEYHPVRDNSTPAGRAANRRVDIVITGPARPASSPAGDFAAEAQDQRQPAD